MTQSASQLTFLKQLTVIGVGLIGGSLALDLKRAKKVRRVVGVDCSQANLLKAQQLGVIDAFMPLEEALLEADLILVSTPVGQMADIFATLAKRALHDAIITDAGSTKVEVATLYQQYLGNRLAYCLPAHPVAGAEQSGATAARYGLYQHHKVVFCPFPETTQKTIDIVQTMWKACGALPCFLDAEVHDQIFASISHLPHLLAFTYMKMLGDKPNIEVCLSLAATAFRDFSRIASSSPEMWRDIALGNREALLREIGNYQVVLDYLYTALKQCDKDALFDLMAKAQQTRETWASQQRNPLITIQ